MKFVTQVDAMSKGDIWNSTILLRLHNHKTLFVLIKETFIRKSEKRFSKTSTRSINIIL